MTALAPGLHPNVPAEQYHRDPAATPSLSASIARTLLERSPAHARANHPRLNPDFVPETDDKFDVGTVAHALVLQGITVAEVMDYPDWRTKAAQEAKALARQHGRIPLLGKQYDEVLAMVNAMGSQLEAYFQECNPLPFTDGQPEVTMVWEEDGVPCRARVDWLHTGYVAISDLKTTSRSARPQPWSERALYDHGCDVQAAAYLRGLKALTGVDAKWRWVVVETSPPYALSVIAPSAAVLAIGEAKWEKALALWRSCLAADKWPAYTTEVHRAELPPWIEARWLERELEAA